MKKLLRSFSRFTLVELMITVAILGVLSALLIPRAPAQSSPQVFRANRWNLLINASGAIATNTTTTTFSYGSTNYNNSTDGTIIIPVYPGRGMYFQGVIANAGSTNATATFGVDLSYDGTNWTTTEPIQFTGLCSGTNQVTFGTNILADRFDNAKYARLGTFVGGTAGNSITNYSLVWSAIP